MSQGNLTHILETSTLCKSPYLNSQDAELLIVLKYQVILKPGNKAGFKVCMGEACLINNYSTVILVLAYFLTPTDTTTATLVSAATSGTGSGVRGETQVGPMERTSLMVGRDRRSE